MPQAAYAQEFSSVIQSEWIFMLTRVRTPSQARSGLQVPHSFSSGCRNYIKRTAIQHADKRPVTASSSLIFGLILRLGFGFSLGIVVLHTFLQGANAFTQALAQLR